MKTPASTRTNRVLGRPLPPSMTVLAATAALILTVTAPSVQAQRLEQAEYLP